MANEQTPGGNFRRALHRDRDDAVIALGVTDALPARIVERAGFEVVYMTGAGTSAARIGEPDVGLITMTEMRDNVEAIAQSVQIPLLADADTGYGDPLNVRRTVKLYERAGAAGLHLEDQSMPKRCSFFTSATLV